MLLARIIKLYKEDYEMHRNLIKMNICTIYYREYINFKVKCKV